MATAYQEYMGRKRNPPALAGGVKGDRLMLKTTSLLITAVSKDRKAEIPMQFACDEELLMFVKTFIHNAEDGSHLRIARGGE